jgi:pimeloyl-ACP methyl ester carboxylesterase
MEGREAVRRVEMIDRGDSMSTVTSADGSTIAFDELGHGPPVVLVGGAFQHRAFDERTSRLADLLASRFTVVHYDRRGRGESGDGPRYAVEREVEDLGAIIGRLGAAKVFGHSSGATLALDAVAAGLPITQLAVYEPPFAVDDSRPPQPPGYVQHLRDLIAADRRDDAVEYFLAFGVNLPAEVVAQMRTAPMWPGFVAVAHTLPYDAAVVDGTVNGQPLPEQRWSSVKIPVLVVDGDASPTWMRNGADALGQLLADPRRITLPGQDHSVAPEALGPALFDFFGERDGY